MANPDQEPSPTLSMEHILEIIIILKKPLYQSKEFHYTDQTVEWKSLYYNHPDIETGSWS